MIARNHMLAWLLSAMAAAETGQSAWRHGDESNEPAALAPPAGESWETPAEAELPSISSESVVESGNAFTAVPREFWNAYFAGRPTKFLLDPQGLLAPGDFRERLAFLDYHAGDSRIDLYVFVFAGDQKIPDEVRDQQLMERSYASGRPAAVLYYFYGKPERSALGLSPSLAARIPETEQRRALESPVIQASKEFDPARQLETFLVQMSIRLYWLETLIAEDSGETGTGQTVKPPAVPQPSKTGVADALGPWIDLLTQWLLPALGMAGGALALALVLRWLRRRTRHRFPDLEVEPRLGGAHAAGVGAVISFANASEPPASQRDQIPGYLRRVR
ncbi:MAG: hypothetical protein ACO3JG_03375 [Luteolibacter sp.]